MLFNEELVKTKIKSAFTETMRNQMAMCKAYVAGGSIIDTIRGRIPKDYDIYIHNEFARNKLCSAWHERNKNVRFGIFSTSTTQCAVTTIRASIGKYATPTIYQIIDEKYLGNDILETLNRFDLKICRVAYSFHEDKIIMGEGFEESLMNNDMGLDALADNNNFTTLTRIMKYKEKGFNVKHEDLADFYMKLAKIKTLEEYQEHFAEISQELEPVVKEKLVQLRIKLEDKEEHKRKLREARDNAKKAITESEIDKSRQYIIKP